MHLPRTNPRRTTAIGLAGPLLAILLAVPLPALADDNPLIVISRPYLTSRTVVFDYELSGFFDPQTFELLESGLPSTLGITAILWRDRSGWWDSRVRSIHFGYKIFYDVIDERYEVFDEERLFVATCRSREEVLSLVGGERGLEMIAARRLNPAHKYYVEVGVRLEPLTVEEIQEFEEWIRGSGVSGIPRFAIGLLKTAIGLGDKAAWERTPVFRLPELAPGRPEGAGAPEEGG